MQPTLGLWCPVHLNRAAELVCLHPSCMESSRILCGECAATSRSHTSHNSSLVRVGKIQSSSDGSSLGHLRNIFFQTSHFEGAGPTMQSVYQFFNALEKEILQELHRVRDGALEAASIRENVMVDIQNELILSEARISTMLESQAQEQISRNSSRESADMNELLLLTNGGFKGEQNNNNNNNLCFSMNVIDACDQEGIDLSYGIDSVERSTRELEQQIAREEHANNNNNRTANNNLVSLEISNELKSLQDSCNEVLIETDIQLHYALSQCHLKLDKFSYQIDNFLKSTLPQKIKPLAVLPGSNKATFQQILKSNYSEEIDRNELKLMNACEFFSSIGYHSCIAVDSIDSLSLLKKVSGQLCHKFEESNQALQELNRKQLKQSSTFSSLSSSDQALGLFGQNLSTSDEQPNCSSSLPANIRCESAPIHSPPPCVANQSSPTTRCYELKQTSWQQNYFFSAFLDNKSIGDAVFLSEIPKQLNQMRYISNLHLDFNNNSLSTISYVALFETLQQFYQLNHLDLRFNHNYAPEAPAVEALTQLLLGQKSSLKLLCITMKQLRHSMKRQHNLSLSSSPSSPLDTSCSSQSSSQQQQQFSIRRSSQAFQEQPRGQQRQQQQLSQQEYSFEPNKNTNNSSRQNPINYLKLPATTTTIQPPQQPPSSQFSQAGDILAAIMSTLNHLTSLEVLYLDFSTNLLESSTVFSSSLNVATLKVLHVALNHTKLPPQQALTLFSSLNKRTTPFHSCKIFVKDNGYSFQQQRTISGQFQKVQAAQKNFDLFF